MNATSQPERRFERAEARLRTQSGSAVRLCAAPAGEAATIHAELRDRSARGCALLVPRSARLSLGGAVTVTPSLDAEAASGVAGVGAGCYRVVRIAPGPHGGLVVGCRRLVVEQRPQPVGQRYWVRGAQRASAGSGSKPSGTSVGVRSGDGSSFGV